MYGSFYFLESQSKSSKNIKIESNKNNDKSFCHMKTCGKQIGSKLKFFKLYPMCSIYIMQQGSHKLNIHPTKSSPSHIFLCIL